MKKRFNSVNIATYFLLAVVVIYILFTLFLYLFVKDWGESGTFGDSFGVLNALFSGLALAGVIYTLNLQVRTFELQRKDSAFNIMPLLVVEPKSGVRNGYQLLVTNIGNGTAMNIDLEPFPLTSDFSVVFKADRRMMSLKAGETKEFEIMPYVGDELADASWTAHLKHDYANRELRVSIIYENIEFSKMQQDFSLGLGELKVTMVKTLSQSR
ncbi:hypothetical protein JI735_34125 (plasmid) [Paenibacillus sonchi]|uniref:Uncharacterized protein n=1 Tax=Paenibacillus sonchi TaxID=373687 RepID=A0A974SGC3_9BACL|nr:hypothetical protein [Paenibacillus sonchi]QQZ64479.1 hypothetical protein JI735_34125 [Paenibacillus sonchi]